MVKSRYIGDGHPTFSRNPYNGYINPYYWVDEFIPYYMEIMGVDRPDRTYVQSFLNVPQVGEGVVLNMMLEMMVEAFLLHLFGFEQQVIVEAIH